MKRAAMTILAAVALMSLVFAAGASGHKVKYESTVTAKFDQQTTMIEGTVDSTQRGCVTKRTVTLRRATGSPPEAGTTLTDSLGAWTLRPPSAGTYFGEAEKKVLRKNTKHRHICAPAVSKEVKVK